MMVHAAPSAYYHTVTASAEGQVMLIKSKLFT